MSKHVSRRELLKLMGLGAAATSAGLAGGSQASADIVFQKNAKLGEQIDGSKAVPCRVENGKVLRPAVEIPSVDETDVLIVGGGPAGAVAAIAAARAGVKTTIVERYNHFGGLATGGLVLVILGHWNDKKIQVVQGIGEEMMQRLEKMPYGITGREIGRNPTIDAEAYKYLLVEMLQEAGVNIFLHAWAIDAITSGDTVQGAVIQTKLGPKAILAKQVVDTTGDGDIFAFAGVPHDRREYIIGLPHRIGNAPKLPKGQKVPRGYGSITPIEGIRWVNMGGPFSDGLDVKKLSELELKHRKKIWSDYLELRKQPGFENTYMLETAPQMGVRITRVVKGTEEIRLSDVRKKTTYESMVGIGGAWNADHTEWQLPYGTLLPARMENILTAGRSICAEPHASDLIRVIPNCWVSGHAAGCAAAVAVKDGTTARSVDLVKVRKLLKDQKAYLG